jgi:hypothetical protein
VPSLAVGAIHHGERRVTDWGGRKRQPTQNPVLVPSTPFRLETTPIHNPMREEVGVAFVGAAPNRR